MLPLKLFLRNINRLGGLPNKYRVLNHCPKKLINSLCTLTTRDDTLAGFIKHWGQRFEDEGIPEPISSIEHILAHVVGRTKIIDLVTIHDQRLTEEQIKKLDRLCECRLARMPVQYIIGEWDFRDITLKLVPPIFIPRPETEYLIDFILKRISENSWDTCRVLEIGCGSGAISLALAHSCKKIKCVAVDQNSDACNLAKENRKNLDLDDRVEIVNVTLEIDGTFKSSSDVSHINFDNEKFDLIVSNPPYIPTKKVMELEPEIKIFEDINALDGGPDGLKVIKPILKYASKALTPTGHVFLEVDPEHPEYIKFFTEKFKDFQLKYLHTYKDFCNNDRFVELSRVYPSLKVEVVVNSQYTATL
ncbi:MTRF1L release factor glutamine methyltransferase-like isoform X1 [Aphidius gifuensis]|uniref:MTRF1L release factor glutamine methyltransferase-like isoform X1 n=1 Tax=Aphidius gifuensis TaxID=684658 RepID=UPI001CDBE2D7|nr:MTRF1L release factor glutamine methyltransferase-like isoform X1 [Aphidius gifuensis]